MTANGWFPDRWFLKGWWADGWWPAYAGIIPPIPSYAGPIVTYVSRIYMMQEFIAALSVDNTIAAAICMEWLASSSVNEE